MSDTGWQPGRWWRAVLDDGTLWCETTDEEEVREAAAEAPRPVTVQRLVVRVQERWEDA